MRLMGLNLQSILTTLAVISYTTFFAQTKELEEIEVRAKTTTEKIKEDPIKAEVLDAKKLQQESSTLTEALNRTSGVKVRLSGGLGSSSNFNINGFSDKAVKFFKDGISVDYMGYGFNVSLLPINMLDRVEVYKGVLPISLGADALGGGVNLVTKTSVKKYIDLSYEYGSFNTHRASANAYFSDSSNKHFIGVDAFHNHSDNSYTVRAKVLDYNTSTLSEKEVTRFHDAFTNTYGDLYGGWRNVKWADELKLSLSAFTIRRENQHGALMTTPYGESVSYQTATMPSIRYKKTLFNKRFSIDQFVVFSRLNTRVVDTCNCLYDWEGNKKPASRNGESMQSGILSNINFDHFVTRTYLTYQLSPSHKLELNNNYSDYSRIGSDPFGSVYFYSGKDILSEKAGYKKSVIGLGYSSKWLNGRIENLIAIKHYYFRTNGTDGAYNSYEGGQQVNENRQYGASEAIKFTLNQRIFMRLGYEYAYRLPEQSEVFGDGQFLLSNFYIKPEKSQNFNFGAVYSKPQKLRVEANVFYRITQDQINLTPVYIPFSQYLNNEQVRGYGLELDVASPITKWMEVFANGTYQSIRLFDLKNIGIKYLEGARLNNTPYFFGNLGTRCNWNKVFTEKDALKFAYYYSYTHSFYLTTIPKNKEPQGLFGTANIDTELIIPTQHVHSTSLIYSIKNDQISFGFEVKNLLNADIYDNFRVQKAGRSYHLKLRYLIK